MYRIVSDDISRGWMMKAILTLKKNEAESRKNRNVIEGLDLALAAVTAAPMTGVWNDTKDPETFPSCMVLVERRQGDFVGVQAATWQPMYNEWTDFKVRIPAEQVTGWMYMPEPRK